MLSLLKFEFRKLFRQKSFYICTAVLLFLTVFQIITSWNFAVSAGRDTMYFVQERVVNAGTTFMFTILLGIFSAIFICDDYSGGTIRVIVTRGFSRTEIYFAKLIVLLTGAIIMLLTSWLVAAITALAVSDGGSLSTNRLFLRTLFSQVLIILAYTCIFNAVSSGLQKNGAAIAGCIVLPIAVSIILSFAGDAMTGAEAENAVNLNKYWLEWMLSEVSIIEPDAECMSLALKLSPVYIIAASILGWLSVFKREY